MAAATSHLPTLSISHGLLWLTLLLFLTGLLAGWFAITEGFAVGPSGVALSITPEQVVVVLSAFTGAVIYAAAAVLLLIP